MFSSNSILQQGDPLLRRRANLVAVASKGSEQIARPGSESLGSESPGSKSPGSKSEVDLQRLIDELLALTIQSNGVGIAAPQVGIGQRLMIVASRPNARYPDAPEMEPQAMINPRLLDRSEKVVSGWEGCLSVPGQRGWVPRSDEIQVEYWDRWGDRHLTRLQGFIARIFQHELDHLDGILFPDRVERAEDLVSEIEFLERLSRKD